MKGGLRFSLAGALMLVSLSGCGRGFFQEAERAPWRHDAEVACMKSGVVKLGPGAVQIDPIEGPGVCGADFPLRVNALGESSALGFADEMRPPAAVPGGAGAARRHAALCVAATGRASALGGRAAGGQCVRRRRASGRADVARRAGRTAKPAALCRATLCRATLYGAAHGRRVRRRHLSQRAARRYSARRHHPAGRQRRRAGAVGATELSRAAAAPRL